MLHAGQAEGKPLLDGHGTKMLLQQHPRTVATVAVTPYM